jgi:hypothetical protein
MGRPRLEERHRSLEALKPWLALGMSSADVVSEGSREARHREAVWTAESSWADGVMADGIGGGPGGFRVLEAEPATNPYSMNSDATRAIAPMTKRADATEKNI